jgi:hypothetical protein
MGSITAAFDHYDCLSMIIFILTISSAWVYVLTIYDLVPHSIILHKLPATVIPQNCVLSIDMNVLLIFIILSRATGIYARSLHIKRMGDIEWKLYKGKA